VDEIGKILPSLLSKQIGRPDPHLLGILIPLWPRIAGKTLAQHSQPARFASGVLTLAADSAMWSTQLQHLTKELRAGINGFLGRPLVRKLRIMTVTQPGVFSPPPPSRRTAAPAPTVVPQAMDLNSIADREVASTLASSYAKYFNRPGR